jgi:hypothetical protein
MEKTVEMYIEMMNGKEWTHPSTGEKRVYLNGANDGFTGRGKHVKFWLVGDKLHCDNYKVLQQQPKIEAFLTTAYEYGIVCDEVKDNWWIGDRVYAE